MIKTRHVNASVMKIDVSDENRRLVSIYLICNFLVTYSNTAHTMRIGSMKSTVSTTYLLWTTRHQFLCTRKDNAQSDVCTTLIVSRSFTTRTTDTAGSEPRWRVSPTRWNTEQAFATSSS